MRPRAIVFTALLVSVNAVNSGSFSATEKLLLVACAPGPPGSTSQAQSSMDDFVARIVEQTGWPTGGLTAVYHEEERAGLDAMAADNAALALVPLPFYLKHREVLELEPLLEVVQHSGKDETWSLVAARGAVEAPAALDGWTVSGMPGYAPRFVSHVALAGWGALPESAEIRFSTRVLTDLRNAAAGKPVAVLLDRAQSDALEDLPFAGKLEVLTSSDAMAGHLLCAVGGRFAPDLVEPLRNALQRLGDSDEGRELFESLRIKRFRPVDDDALAGLESDFSTEASGED